MPVRRRKGTSTATSTVTGVGVTAAVAVGSSAGVATVVGWRPSGSFGGSFATSAVAAVSLVTFVAIGAASGAATAQSMTAVTSSSSNLGEIFPPSVVTAVSVTLARTAAASAGVAATSAEGASVAAATGGSANGTTAIGLTNRSAGSAAGTSFVQALTPNTVSVRGFAEGTDSAQAFTPAAVGASGNISASAGVAASSPAAYGTAAGTSTVFGSSQARLLSMDFVSRRISSVDVPSWFTAAHTSLLRDAMYFVLLDEIYTQQVGTELIGLWRSKRFVADHHPTFAWLRLEGPVTSAVVRLYADGELFYTTPAIVDNMPVRLPAGRAREWEIELESTGPVTQIVLTTTSDEMRKSEIGS